MFIKLYSSGNNVSSKTNFEQMEKKNPVSFHTDIVQTEKTDFFFSTQRKFNFKIITRQKIVPRALKSRFDDKNIPRYLVVTRTFGCYYD